MRSVDLDKLDQLPGRRLDRGTHFNFQCHPGIGCFNRCCRNLNLYLYPYDVLRLKNGLEISSDAFLDRYVDVVLRPGNHFPEVLLRMADSESKTCPFLTDEGCYVYKDRPDTCRTFPVEQGAMIDAATGKAEIVSFFRPPEFCLGQHEDQVWTPETWAQDQDAQIYNQMTARWAAIKSRFQQDPFHGAGPDCAQGKMAFMALYNGDRFREFVFQSTFLKRYKVSADVRRRLKKNDLELLKFAFDWVKLYLWGVPTRLIKPR